MFVKCAQVAATNNDYKVFVATQELANYSNSVPNADVPDYYPMMISARAYESARQYITEKTVTVFAWSSTM